MNFDKAPKSGRTLHVKGIVDHPVGRPVHPVIYIAIMARMALTHGAARIVVAAVFSIEATMPSHGAAPPNMAQVQRPTIVRRHHPTKYCGTLPMCGRPGWCGTSLVSNNSELCPPCWCDAGCVDRDDCCHDFPACLEQQPNRSSASATVSPIPPAILASPKTPRVRRWSIASLLPFAPREAQGRYAE